MALVSGSRFGPYEIAGEIGAGGMGVVYLARDTKLAREVAIKVLPKSMASDSERLARFDREAKTLASLNHPNIAQIYGLEESDGTTALILELVEGPTLEDRIAEGTVPVAEALDIAMQIANALEAAHGQGIVHRDLKPANIKLRPDGTVKVLDFGIAKALDIRAISGAVSPVMTTPAVTETGIILGTAGYMSPEQARGKGVDERTDIWAFGCLLYEMLTGQPAFGAEDVTVTLARILERDPDLDSLPGAVSANVRQTIQVCLQKDVRRRVADIRDVRLALEGAFESVSPLGDEVAAVQPLWRRALSVAAAVLVTGVVVGFTVWLRMQPEPPTVTRFDYELPAGQVFRNSGSPMLAVSRDGRQFVYNTSDGLYLRTMDELGARLIPGTEEVFAAPIFSPDGQAVAYLGLSGQLERIPISGGTAFEITAISDLAGAIWHTDGTILFSVPRTGIHRVSASGGEPEVIVSTEGGKHGADLLPDGDSFLFSEATPGVGFDSAQIVVRSLSTGERTALGLRGSDPRYLPTGHIVYALGDTLFAAAFNPDTLSVSGAPVPVVQGVLRSTDGQTGAVHYDVSENGTLVYATGSITPNARELVWVDRDGREEPIAAPPRPYLSPRLSPNDDVVAVNLRDQDVDIWTLDLVRGQLTRFTFDPGPDASPVWSLDGLRIAYASRGGVYSRAADGASPEEPLWAGSTRIFPQAFVPPGGAALIGTAENLGEDTSDDIAVVNLNEDETVTPLLATSSDEHLVHLSPDGSWLAYTSDESGRNEIYVRPFPNVEDGRWQISLDGGEQPLWSRNSQELFYRNGDAMMAVEIQTDAGFVAGRPEVLFTGQYLLMLDRGGRDYDYDGERFLMVKQVEDTTAASEIIVVQNWFDELNRLLPLSPNE